MIGDIFVYIFRNKKKKNVQIINKCNELITNLIVFVINHIRFIGQGQMMLLHFHIDMFFSFTDVALTHAHINIFLIVIHFRID